MGDQLKGLVAAEREAREETLRKLSALREDQLVYPAEWSGMQRPIRFLLYRLADHYQEHGIQITKALRAIGREASEAEMILAVAEARRGYLEGLLVGLSDEEMNKKPAEGEWSVGEVLRHVIDVEKRYASRVEDALAKARS